MDGFNQSNVKNSYSVNKNIKQYLPCIDTKLKETNEQICYIRNHHQITGKRFLNGIIDIDISVQLNVVIDEDQRKKCYYWIEQMCIEQIDFQRIPQYSVDQTNNVNEMKKIQLPNCVKGIFNYPNNRDKLPFSLDGIEVLQITKSCELIKNNSLKELLLHDVFEIEFNEKELNKDEMKEWKEGECCEYFTNLKKIEYDEL